MNHSRAVIILSAIICAGIFACGCSCPKEPPEDQKIVAKINKYNMTVEDFRSSARASGGTKEQILEGLIDKNILIQEAQKQNFDKDKAFMKEIERYWEQALLKLLIKKKNAEFSETFKGDKGKAEVAMDKWVKELRSKANVKIYKENLDKVTIR